MRERKGDTRHTNSIGMSRKQCRPPDPAQRAFWLWVPALSRRLRASSRRVNVTEPESRVDTRRDRKIEKRCRRTRRADSRPRRGPTPPPLAESPSQGRSPTTGCPVMSRADPADPPFPSLGGRLPPLSLPSPALPAVPSRGAPSSLQLLPEAFSPSGPSPFSYYRPHGPARLSCNSFRISSPRFARRFTLLHRRTTVLARLVVVHRAHL